MERPAPDRPLRYLRPEDLALLRGCRFTPRRPVLGHYTGGHASPLRGQSVEFTDYREYLPGDDVGSIDWKVYGRSDRLFIRLFEHQSDMTVHLLVDASNSMSYAGIAPRTPGPERVSKYDHACRLAAAIAFLVTRRQDRVGLAVAQEGLRRVLPPRSSYPHLHQLAGALENFKPRGGARFAQSLTDLAEQTGRRGLLVVCSDLHEPPEPTLDALGRFLHRGHEVIVFHVLHAEELELPDIGEAVFQDSETSARLRVNIPDVRAKYEENLLAYLDQWSVSLRGRGIDYNLVSTATPYNKAMERYLFARDRAL
ncbi:MAG: DUF58 domain-containing protein [Planctomycetes bacterium]|nr:DUF58 domain-containing protein [Planctomycetota bacterium]